MSTPTFKQAAEFVMPFGKHQGRTLDQIAERDNGLLYLDWLRGEMDGDPPHFGSGRAAHVALTVYLDDPTIVRELRDLL